MKLTKSAGLRGELSIPGDKSISHRAVMFGSLSKRNNTYQQFFYQEQTACQRSIVS